MRPGAELALLYLNYISVSS